MSFLFFLFFPGLPRPNQRRPNRSQQYHENDTERDARWNLVRAANRGRDRFKSSRMKSRRQQLRQQGQQHFHADESEHDTKTSFQIMEFLDDAGEEKIKS